MPRIQTLLIFVLLVAAAAALRFHSLGKWSFGFDELYTTLETKVLFGEMEIPEKYLQSKDGPVAPEDSQYSRLPRLIFGAHTVHWIGYKLFGEDEFGSRVLMAAIGSLTVGVVFLLARPLLGFPGATFLAMLIIVWPEHLVQSQTNRFYSQAFFFVALVFLLGAHVAVNRSVKAALWLGPCAILMVLNHSLGGVIWGILLGGLVADLILARREEGRSVPWKPVLILAVWSVALLGIAWFHILPLSSGWNKDVAAWGYSPKYSVMTFAVVTLGWPTALLGGMGLCYSAAMLRKPGSAYWLFAVLACGVCVVALPLKVVYNPQYHLLFALPFLYVAAMLIARLYSLMSESDIPLRRCLAWIGIVLCVFSNLPVLASYYKDGYRDDLRGAFGYVRQHWRDGDAWVGPYMQFADYYIPDLEPRIRLPSIDVPKNLEKILDSRRAAGGRTWILLGYNRDGMPPELRHIVTKHAVFVTEFRKRRYDFNDCTLELYRLDTTPNE